LHIYFRVFNFGYWYFQRVRVLHLSGCFYIIGTNIILNKIAIILFNFSDCNFVIFWTNLLNATHFFIWTSSILVPFRGARIVFRAYWFSPRGAICVLITAITSCLICIYAIIFAFIDALCFTSIRPSNRMIPARLNKLFLLIDNWRMWEEIIPLGAYNLY
jgi:hypothetical protein